MIRRGYIILIIGGVLFVVGIIIAAVWAIPLLFVPQVLWFVFPLVGWGSGLAIHYYLGVHTAPRRIEKDGMMAENMARGGLATSLA